jgi:DNA-binding NarL/FixJ family response regulator
MQTRVTHSAMPIRVIIYEDNQDLRDGLSVLLGNAESIELVGAFANCEKVRAQVESLRPHAVLMDIDMPVVNGMAGLKTIRQHFPEVNVLMLTVFEQNEYVFEALCAGAVGYLLKKTPPDRLIEAIAEAQSGGAPMTSNIARKVLQMFSQPAVPEDNPHHLTDREKEVLALLVKGNSYKMIAAASNISLDTVRSHIKKIYEKLHVHSQTEAVAKAIRQRLV